MANEARIRSDVNDLLSKSLKREHFIKIKQECPGFASYDENNENLLYHLERDIKCISGTDFSGLIDLLNNIGLEEVAKRIPAAQNVPEEKYDALKNEIIELCRNKKFKKDNMGQFKNQIIDCYKVKCEDLEHCSMGDIIEELEEHRLLSRSRSDILRFKQIFITCGCRKVVDCINSLENVTGVDETPMDTTDARAVNTPHQHAHPSGRTIPEGIQEQNPGSSESTTGGGDQSGIHTRQAPTTGASPTTTGDQSGIHPRRQAPTTGASPTTTGDQSSGRHTCQTPNTGAYPTTGQHVGSGLQQSAKTQAHSQAHSHGTMFTASNVGTNINIAPGTTIHSLNISSDIPGHGNNPGQVVYGQGHGNHGHGYSGPSVYGQAQGSPGQDAYYPPQNVPKPPGYLPNQVLMYICEEIGGNWRMLGLTLGFPWNALEKMQCNYRKIEEAIMNMLILWRDQQPSTVNQLEKMCKALKDHQNIRLADDVRTMMKNK